MGSMPAEPDDFQAVTTPLHDELDTGTPDKHSRTGRGQGLPGVQGFHRRADLSHQRVSPELKRLASAEVAISPVALRALVKHGTLTDEEARDALERMAEGRDWLEAPI